MSLEQSKAYRYVLTKEWPYRTTDTQIIVESCPICGNPNWKFYISFTDDKDGLWKCMVCSESGNLYTLREYLGDRGEGTTSIKDAAHSANRPQKLPDVEKLHEALLQDNEAMSYLLQDRGYSTDVIIKYKLGVEIAYDKKWLVIPSFHNGNLIYVKWRTMPPEAKEFRGISGREAPLFNQDCLVRNLDEVLFVEGEADCLAALSNGIESVVGIPGASLKKTAWIDMLDDIDPKKIYIAYDLDKAGQIGAKELAKRIGLNKCYNIILPEFVTAEGKPGKDLAEWFKSGGTLEQFEELKAQARQFPVDGVFPVVQVVADILSDVEQHGSLKPKYDSPWPSVNALIGGMEDGDVVGLLAEGKVGKEQPLSAKVLTTRGWTTMGKLCIGEHLASIDGQTSIVTGIYPQGKKQMFRVAFSDGRSTLCGAEHLWKIGSSSNFTRDGYKVVNTSTLKTMLSEAKTKAHTKWFIPLFCGEFQKAHALPIDPWLLGALLGDGGFTNGTPIITKDDDILLNMVNHIVKSMGCTLNFVDRISWRIATPRGKQNPVTNILRLLGLMGHRSEEKFIPDCYKQSSKETRISLLCGLMDTDGSLEGVYKCPTFNTSSRQLALDVQDIVRSLGGIATIGSRIPSYKHKGKAQEGLEAYRVYIKQLDRPCFKHSVKAAKYREPSRSARLTIVSVEPEGIEEAQCISVSHPSNLYVTDDYIVTHNTTVALNWLHYLANQYDEPSMLHCQEMMPKRLVRKWVSMVTETDDDKITKDTVQTALGVGANMRGDYLFGYTPGAKFKEVAETMRQARRRYGVKFFAFDNLQFLCRSLEHSSQETSSISKGFKDLMMELGTVLLLIIQPNRVRDGEIAAARNSMGSSAIEKDVDAMLCFHRGRQGKIKEADFEAMPNMDVAENFTPQLLVRADLTRYAPGGVKTLWMHGAQSRVTEFPTEDFFGQSNVVGIDSHLQGVVAA